MWKWKLCGIIKGVNITLIITPRGGGGYTPYSDNKDTGVNNYTGHRECGLVYRIPFCSGRISARPMEAVCMSYLPKDSHQHLCLPRGPSPLNILVG